MSTLAPPADPESDPRVKAVFDDIRATRKSDVVNNFWLYLAFDPALLEDTWRGVKEVMAEPSALDPLTKELIYIAVSITNSCRYCVHSHTAAARAKGMTDDMLCRSAARGLHRRPHQPAAQRAAGAGRCRLRRRGDS